MIIYIGKILFLMFKNMFIFKVINEFIKMVLMIKLSIFYMINSFFIRNNYL